MSGKRIVVIGGGPGGYVAAIRAAQLGASVTLAEKGKLGGTCLNVGCIPTKALLHTAELYETVRRKGAALGIVADGLRLDWDSLMARKRTIVEKLTGGVGGILKSNGVEVLYGTAKFLDHRTAEVDGTPLSADAFIVAVGSEPSMPPIPGLDLDGVITSSGALELDALPESIAIAGGGVIGVEFASLFSALGVKVTVVELLPQILPMLDADLAGTLLSALSARGVTFHTASRLERVSRSGRHLALEVTTPGGPVTVTADKLLVAVGRRPMTRGLGLESLGVSMERGRILTDERMATTVPEIYAIGDCAGPIQLAHTASAEGETAAENLMGHPAKMDYKTVPSAIYTSPEAASVGLSEREARDRGHSVRVGVFPLMMNGKSLIEDDISGFVKIIADERYDEILGVQMVGPRATDMIAEAALALRLEATAEELISTIHAHPTISEAVREAALSVFGRAIHLPRRG
jgi:dihydrolipoamide dehydrogenase